MTWLCLGLGLDLAIFASMTNLKSRPRFAKIWWEWLFLHFKFYFFGNKYWAIFVLLCFCCPFSHFQIQTCVVKFNIVCKFWKTNFDIKAYKINLVIFVGCFNQKVLYWPHHICLNIAGVSSLKVNKFRAEIHQAPVSQFSLLFEFLIGKLPKENQESWILMLRTEICCRSWSECGWSGRSTFCFRHRHGKCNDQHWTRRTRWGTPLRSWTKWTGKTLLISSSFNVKNIFFMLHDLVLNV